MESKDKKTALDLAIAAIHKAHGKDSIFSQAEAEIDSSIQIISTGSLGLDRALGVGGYPRGRIVEIMGQEASGKSTLCLHAVAEAQKAGGIVAYIDSEFSLDLPYADSIGVDTSTLLISQPDNGEQALDIVDMLAKSGAIDLVIVDSVAALVPQVELEGTISDQQMGLQARLMSKAMRMLAGSLYKANTCLIMTNQYRQKIGGYGNPNVTSGGNSLKYYATQRLEVSKKGPPLGEEEARTGISCHVKVVKNKVAPPYREVDFEIGFGKGIEKEKELVQIASDMDIINKAGSWFSYKGEKIGQGLDTAMSYFTENPKLFQEVREQVLGRK